MSQQCHLRYYLIIDGLFLLLHSFKLTHGMQQYEIIQKPSYLLLLIMTSIINATKRKYITSGKKFVEYTGMVGLGS